ncbi:MAG: (4Fe-4S)-binding protein [Bacteroidota bacterium]
MPIKTHKYSNKDITIIWKPEVCIHSKLCWHNLREVFDPARKPWILPEAAETEKIIAQINKCPSGALSYIRNEAIAENLPPANEPAAITAAVNIECLLNGPLVVTGEIVVKKSDGTEEIKTGPIALCRCGASKNKPYCDGGHKTVGFIE